jgi:arylsulfatase A
MRVTRRDFLKASALTGAALATSGYLSTADGETKKPNLIVMMADDLGAKELACYGNPQHETPNLDNLAETGVQFKTCYATPICHPTRFMIMTGQYGHHNGVYQFPGRRGGPEPDSPVEDMKKHFTFAHMLKKAGYTTALAGKWQLPGELPDLVYDAGFDEYRMWAYRHNLPKGVKHTGGWENKQKTKTSRYWHPSILKNTKYQATKPDDYGPKLFADFVIDFIQRRKDQPFFVYCPMCLTHAPWYPTPDTIKAPEDRFKRHQSNFKANVEYMDKMVGRIIQSLDDLGIRDNTVVFFTGDNGTGGSGKGKVTELGARVPMIVNCPGLVKAIGPSDALVDLSDIFPTLADYADAPLPVDRPIDGRSFAPILRGEKSDVREWIYSYLGDGRILRDKRWLLEGNSPHKPGRLYDCGDSRDGSGYKDVTDSSDADIIAAQKRFEEILKDKPVPIVPPDFGKKKS